MKVREIASYLEGLAPLELQESYDNSGLQVGYMHQEVSKVLVCLDITEDVIEEAHREGAQMIISHHPLIFRALKCVSNKTYQQRCVVKALSYGISLYAAHTNLDNAVGGVNYKIAEKIGLTHIDGSIPLVGEFEEPMKCEAFLEMLQKVFAVKALKYVGDKASIKRVALCGGAGAFLREEAQNLGVDCFITGELHYHDYFEAEGMLLVELGHYESEQYTIELIKEKVEAQFPVLEVVKTTINTNPINLRIA